MKHPIRAVALTLGFTLALAHILSLPASAEFRAGAALIDITPPTLPVLVNGGMVSRSVDRVTTRLHARAIALADAHRQVAIVVVDSCMLGRPLLDEAKARAATRTGIPPHHLLIAATHTHSAPSAFACLGTEADPTYVPFLLDRLVDVIAAAHANLEPARIGWARTRAPEFTALRRWIRRPDRLGDDPFGNPTVRANMHAAAHWNDVTGESGPEDPDLTLLSLQALDGRPIAVLANFSMHYFGDDGISADYFGRFSEGLEARLAPNSLPDRPPFVGILSHGCSGDIWRVDYRIPAPQRPNPTLDAYTRGLLDLAVRALDGLDHRTGIDLAMAEHRMTLQYRVPDRQRLEWARRIVAELGDRPPTTTTEVYAREQLLLHEQRQTEIVLQALRVGDIALATTPTETYAITGLKIKAASPLPKTMVFDLANGGDGYIPPPEQHLFGGYNTWPARSAGLDVTAEPRITEAAIALLETVSGQPRRPWRLPDGPAARTVIDSGPLAYWRLNEFTGPHAADATPHGRDAVYEPWITFHLDGPRPEAFGSTDAPNRAPHFVGGRLRARLPDLGVRYSVSLWIWNGMPHDGRAFSGWFFSRGFDHGLGRHSHHLGIGGAASHPGHLVFLHGDRDDAALAGHRLLPRWEWHHVALVRDGTHVCVYLNGQPEITTTLPDETPAAPETCFFGGRSDNAANWEGRLDEIAVFDRALSDAEIARLASD